MKSIPTRNPWNAAGIALAMLFIMAVLIKIAFPGGITRFAGFGEHFAHRYIPTVHELGAFIKEDSGGYDGQFYAQIATRPDLSHPDFDTAIDEPAYRARRIFPPLIAHWLAGGHPEWSILVYCSLNILIWFGFAHLVWNWIMVHDARTFARWCACVLSIGVMDSVKYSLTDLPSVYLILLMLRYAQTHRLGVAAGMVAAVFTKETNILASAALPDLKQSGRKWFTECVRWGGVATFAGILFLLWYRYINWRFEPFAGVQGNFDWPFTSMLRNFLQAWTELLSGNVDDRFIFRILAVLGLSIQAAWLFSQCRRWREPLVRLGLVYAVLFVLLGDLVWWGYWAVCRVVLPMTLTFNLLFDGKTKFWPLLIAANLTVIHSLYRFF